MKFFNKHRALIILIGFMSAVFVAKLIYLPFDYHGDYISYENTARYIGGDSGEVSAARMLKPLGPALVAIVAQTGASYKASFLFVLYLFFIALVVASFALYRNFFQNERRALFASIITIVTYPMIRYGLDAYTETGAWFFYLAGLWSTLLFVKRPSMRLLLLNAAIASLGFLWKEYSVLHMAIFGLMTLFSKDLPFYRKLRYLIFFTAIVVGISALWQSVVYQVWHYSYFTWYTKAGASSFGLPDYSLVSIGKSLFALLLIGWAYVPFAWNKLSKFAHREKLFLTLTLLIPCVVFAWGSVSSRLFYVLIPSLAIAAVYGSERISHMLNKKHSLTIETALVFLIPVSHLAWTWYKYFG